MGCCRSARGTTLALLVFYPSSFVRSSRDRYQAPLPLSVRREPKRQLCAPGLSSRRGGYRAVRMKVEPDDVDERERWSPSAQLVDEDEQLDERRRERRLARVAALEQRIARLASPATGTHQGAPSRPSGNFSTSEDPALVSQRRSVLLHALVDRPTPRSLPADGPLALLPLAHSLESVASLQRSSSIVAQDHDEATAALPGFWGEAARSEARPARASTGRQKPSSETLPRTRHSPAPPPHPSIPQHEVRRHSCSPTDTAVSAERATYDAQRPLRHPQHAPGGGGALASPRKVPYIIPSAAVRYPPPPSYISGPASSSQVVRSESSTNHRIDPSRRASISISTYHHLHGHQLQQPRHPQVPSHPSLTTASPTFPSSSADPQNTTFYPSSPSTTYSAPAAAPPSNFSPLFAPHHPLPLPPALHTGFPPSAAHFYRPHGENNLGLTWHAAQPPFPDPSDEDQGAESVAWNGQGEGASAMALGRPRNHQSWREGWRAGHGGEEGRTVASGMVGPPGDNSRGQVGTR